MLSDTRRRRAARKRNGSSRTLPTASWRAQAMKGARYAEQTRPLPGLCGMDANEFTVKDGDGSGILKC